jgi:hypothetical protein
LIQVQETPIPSGLEISAFVPGSQFADCFVAPNPWPKLSAMAIFLRAVESPPRWVRSLMWLRNGSVSVLGLKNLGGLQEVDANKAAAAYRVGERAGIFTVLHLSESELVLGDNDKHLEVRISVSKRLGASGQPEIATCTVVHEHNRLGKAYMLVVGPIHKIIVPAMLRRGLAPR